MKNQDGTVRAVTVEEAEKQYRQFLIVNKLYEDAVEADKAEVDEFGAEALEYFEELSEMVMNILEGRGQVSKMIQLEDAVENDYEKAMSIIEKVLNR